MAQKTIDTRIVLRNDSTDNWSTAKDTAVLLSGEVGIEILSNGKTKMKIGDGESTWAELPYFGGEEAKYFEVSALSEITETELAKGDVAVVKAAIYTDASDSSKNKYSYTGYTWNGEAWAAMDGNYSADNVYFAQDLQVTEKIGTIQTLTNGAATLKAEGKNLTQVLSSLLATEKNPSGTKPSASISVSGGSDEVGKTFTLPTATLTIDGIGSYTYGPATGIKFEAGNVTLSQGTDNTITNTSDFVRGDKLTLQATGNNTIYGDDAVSFTFAGTASHTKGADALTNLGNVYTNASKNCPIAAASVTVSSKTATFTGYRNWFTYVGDDLSTIDSSWIRTNCAVKGNAKDAADVDLSVAAGKKRVVIALPIGTGYAKRVKACIDVDGMGLDIFNASPSKFEQKTVSVEGANNYNGMDYIAYVYENANGLAKTTLKVTIR